MIKAGVLGKCDFVFLEKPIFTNIYGVQINCGSQDDPVGTPGIAHLLEHVIFHSSPAQDIIRGGGCVQAMTEREKTTYICQIPTNYNCLFNRFLDSILTPAFNQESIHKEKQSVLDEYAAVHKDGIVRIIDSLYQLMFPKQGLGKPVLGCPAAIQQIEVEDLVTFHAKHYQLSNIVVIQMGSAINSTYMPNGGVFRHVHRTDSFSTKINTGMPKFGWEVSSTNSNIFLLGFPVYTGSDNKKSALVLLERMLQRFADEYVMSCNDLHALTWQFSFQCKLYRDVGILFCLIAGKGQICKRFLSQLREKVKQFIRNGFTDMQIYDTYKFSINYHHTMIADPLTEIKTALQDVIQSANIGEYEGRVTSPISRVNRNVMNTVAEYIFAPSAMHYYAKCSADMYSLPYIIHI